VSSLFNAAVAAGTAMPQHCYEAAVTAQLQKHKPVAASAVLQQLHTLAQSHPAEYSFSAHAVAAVEHVTSLYKAFEAHEQLQVRRHLLYVK
jgi:hypothetical protein